MISDKLPSIVISLLSKYVSVFSPLTDNVLLPEIISVESLSIVVVLALLYVSTISSFYA